MAHTTDVDGMLSRMSHEQFDEWCAKDLIEPIGHKPVYEVLARIGIMIAGLSGREIDETYFTPWGKTHKVKTEKPTPATSAKMMTSHMQMIMMRQQ